jgi:hypothetical protein
MTTTNALPSETAPHTPLRGVITTEWTHLRSVRSTYWSLLAAMLMIGLGALIGVGTINRYDRQSLPERDL